MVHPQSAEVTALLSSLSQFYSVWDPSPRGLTQLTSVPSMSINLTRIPRRHVECFLSGPNTVTVTIMMAVSGRVRLSRICTQQVVVATEEQEPVPSELLRTSTVLH